MAASGETLKQKISRLERHVAVLERENVMLREKGYENTPTVERADRLTVRSADIAEAAEDAAMMARVAKLMYERLGVIGGKVKLDFGEEEARAYIQEFLGKLRKHITQDQMAAILADLGARDGS